MVHRLDLVRAAGAGLYGGRAPPATARPPWSSRRPTLQQHNLMPAAVAFLQCRLRGQQSPIPLFR
jgi:hypothetical protein